MSKNRWQSLATRWIKPLGSLKAAVILIFSLAAILVAGTLYESYYSRAYAYALVYGAVWFHLVLLFLGLNILVAALVRLPYKKHLGGFYISHLGLLLILAGSLLTLIFGIDGTLTLPPGQANNLVRLDEPVLYAQVDDTNHFDQIHLPKTVFPKNLNQLSESSGLSIFIKRYLPYAKEEPLFEPIAGAPAGYEGSGVQFTLFAPQVSSKAVLSSPPSDYPEMTPMGLLKVIHLGPLADSCTISAHMSAKPWLLIAPEGCFSLSAITAKGAELAPELKISGLELLHNNLSFRLESSGGPKLLVPATSTWPLKESTASNLPKAITPDFTAPYRLYASAEVFATKALIFFIQAKTLHLLIHDPSADDTLVELKPNVPVNLPWMKLRLVLDRWSSEGIPRRNFVATEAPAGGKDATSAVAVQVAGYTRWLATGMDMVRIPAGDRTVGMFLGFRTFALPWSFSLERFKMDTDPGTQNPASYESFINIHTAGFQNAENAHIYMNNPLKKGKYTFYQASYFPTEGDAFGSVLQVNYDPGRWLKYAGSLILVAGTMYHFYLRRQRRAKGV